MSINIIHKAIFFDFKETYKDLRGNHEDRTFTLSGNLSSLNDGSVFIYKKDYKPDILRDTILTSIKENISLENNDTIYLTPLCKIPRYRIDSYIHDAKLNVKKSYTLGLSNKVYLDKKETAELLDRTLHSSEILLLTKEEFIDLINKDKKTKIRYRDNSYKLVDIDISKIKHDYIAIRKPYYSYDLDSLLGDKKYKSIISASGTEMKEIQFIIELYEKLIQGNNKFIVCNDASILKQTNSELAIDEDVYNSLRDMLSSTSNDNINIAKEIIANCDYDKSYIYLMFLIHEFYHKLFGGTKSGNYNMFLKKYKQYKNTVKTYNWFDYSLQLIKYTPQYSYEIKKFMVKRFNIQAGREIVVDIILKEQ